MILFRLEAIVPFGLVVKRYKTQRETREIGEDFRIRRICNEGLESRASRWDPW